MTVSKTCESGFTKDGSDCYLFSSSFFLSESAKPNKPMLYGGLGAVGGGAFLLLANKRGVSLSITPAGGLFLGSTVKF